MSKILELREKRAKAWEAAKAFLDAKRTQEGFVSAEDAATYDKMENDVVNLGKESRDRKDRLPSMQNFPRQQAHRSPTSRMRRLAVTQRPEEQPMSTEKRSGTA